MCMPVPALMRVFMRAVGFFRRRRQCCGAGWLAQLREIDFTGAAAAVLGLGVAVLVFHACI